MRNTKNQIEQQAERE